jgi:GNAT superfamily N-acetyltransferase
MSSGAAPEPAPGVTDPLARCLELDRRVVLRGAPDVARISGGWVIRHPDLPSVYDLNTLLIFEPLADDFGAPELIRLADRWLADLDHRAARIEDARAAERMTPDLLAAGWQRRRTVLMVLADDAPPRSPDPRARRLSDDELNVIMLADFSETDYGGDFSPGLPEMLVDAQAAVRAATAAVPFGAGEDGGLQSMCTLFLDDDVDGARLAMVEQVATLASHRERGLAKAVVSAAVAAAREWQADLVLVPADADDWPQLLYAGLGFKPVGGHTTFQLRPGRGAARAAV